VVIKTTSLKHLSGFGGSPYYPPFRIVSTHGFFTSGP
jgi:hypothetical protein